MDEQTRTVLSVVNHESNAPHKNGLGTKLVCLLTLLSKGRKNGLSRIGHPYQAIHNWIPAKLCFMLYVIP